MRIVAGVYGCMAPALPKATLLLLAVAVMLSLPLQGDAQKSGGTSGCSGLHAILSADVIQDDGSDPHVELSFLLLNDSDTSQNTQPESWKLFIDGKEVQDPMFFGNGPMPVKGWGTLGSGAFYQFGKTLLMTRYFPRKGQYAIYWSGRDFRTPTVKVQIGRR